MSRECALCGKPLSKDKKIPVCVQCKAKLKERAVKAGAGAVAVVGGVWALKDKGGDALKAGLDVAKRLIK